jgi:zinc/manganese transport system permease protein
VAEAKGLPMLLLGMIFMLLVAIAVSISVQVVGVLLIFSLMVTPAAIAHRLAKRPRKGIIISVAVALIATWTGLFIAFYEPYPVSFFITSIVFIMYVSTLILQRISGRPSGIGKVKSKNEHEGQKASNAKEMV